MQAISHRPEATGQLANTGNTLLQVRAFVLGERHAIFSPFGKIQRLETVPMVIQALGSPSVMSLLRVMHMRGGH